MNTHHTDTVLAHHSKRHAEHTTGMSDKVAKPNALSHNGATISIHPTTEGLTQ